MQHEMLLRWSGISHIGLEHADSDPVLAARHCVPRSTRDDDDNILRSSRQALAVGNSIKPFQPVRMKFNILNFILTHSSGPILLGNPDMERRYCARSSTFRQLRPKEQTKCGD
jgi:hypothetical protein